MLFYLFLQVSQIWYINEQLWFKLKKKIWFRNLQEKSEKVVLGANFLVLIWTKTEWNYFFNSALASKMSQIKKMKAFYYINQGIANTFIYLTHFRSLRQKSKSNFVRVLVQMRTRKFASEIHRPSIITIITTLSHDY